MSVDFKHVSNLMLVKPAGSYSLGLSVSILVGVAAVLIAFCGQLYPRLGR